MITGATPRRTAPATTAATAGAAGSLTAIGGVDSAKLPKVLHCTQDLTGHTGAVYSLAYAPSGRFLASVSHIFVVVVVVVVVAWI